MRRLVSLSFSIFLLAIVFVLTTGGKKASDSKWYYCDATPKGSSSNSIYYYSPVFEVEDVEVDGDYETTYVDVHDQWKKTFNRKVGTSGYICSCEQFSSEKKAMKYKNEMFIENAGRSKIIIWNYKK